MAAIAVVSMIGLGSLGVVYGNESQSAVTANEALQKLLDGNQRYTEAKATHPEQNRERREEIAKAQHPFATVLTCSDSRVAPEIIFDQGLGDIFEVRVAGNVADDAVVGSVEYAAEHLNTPLVVVLGHERCGAVEAAVKGGEIPGHIRSLTKEIKPAVEVGKKQPGDLVDNVVRINIARVVEKLKTSKPILAELVKEHKLTIVGAYYDLDDGTVKVLPQ